MADTVEDYRRVCREEYLSAFVSSGVFLGCGYGLCANLQQDSSYTGLFLYTLILVISGPLASSSFRQGKVMRAKISELEREIGKK